MKKVIEKEVFVCDKCGVDQAYMSSCLNCGTHICYACADEHAVLYSHGVHVAGTGDGFYCKPCNVALVIGGKDQVFMAYLEILALKLEAERFYTDFKIRSKAAEQRLTTLQQPK